MTYARTPDIPYSERVKNMVGRKWLARRSPPKSIQLMEPRLGSKTFTSSADTRRETL
jgi:hypothetical protein